MERQLCEPQFSKELPCQDQSWECDSGLQSSSNKFLFIRLACIHSLTLAFFIRKASVSAKKPTCKCGQLQAQNIYTECRWELHPVLQLGATFSLAQPRLLLVYTEENSPTERKKLYFQEDKVFAHVTYFTHTIIL